MKSGSERDREKGMMTVEACLSLIVFIVVVLVFVNFTNVFMVHNKIQYSLNTAAQELASVSYPYAFLQLKNAKKTWHNDGSKYTEPIEVTGDKIVDSYKKISELDKNMKQAGSDFGALAGGDYSSISNIEDDINSVISSGRSAASSVKEAKEHITELAKDPHGLLVGLIYEGGDAVAALADTTVGSAVAKGLTSEILRSELSQEGQSADQWLKNYGIAGGIDGLDFEGSSCFYDENQSLIRFQVSYELRLPALIYKGGNTRITQCAVVTAWTDGDGKYLGDYR